MQKPEYFRRWAAEVPEDFVFALKGSRYITPTLKLRNIERPRANFFASGMLALVQDRAGAVAVSAEDAVRREAVCRVLAMLPRTTSAIAELARGRDDKMLPRSVLWERVSRRLEIAAG